MKNFYLYIILVLSFLVIFYFGIGFYIANMILRIDHSCGVHEGSLPNTWVTKYDTKDIKNNKRILIREKFDAKKYHLDSWEEVKFLSRDSNIEISGWLFNYHKNMPIVIVVHGIFPNGKCKSEPNLIASLLIKNNINALTIDLRNYGESTIVGNYENLGLTEYLDVLGAFDFLQTIGFESSQIGLAGISLGASTVIFAASKEKKIKAIWSESSLAEFKMILDDEVKRYGFSNIFSFSVSLAGKLLTGIDPADLNPTYAISNHQNYFFTHGENDERIYLHHFLFIKDYAERNNINAEFWMIPEAGHVDSIFILTEEYGYKMKKFFLKNLRK
ncbi:MAG: hypothetical protein CFH18_00883 [Alphaproteobacteria bacterium MarineAlpha5_Bin8]|nr:MAG: hypothetical protein CFH18_00883 [Alphaproteobacteria bacterium MarineAlpha5_Bin8]PPR46088.1 MAG: hypothetical protein CFH17_00190 [Alphaproteobacteria bacterium MarineAlpha5_Bin7]|tara:strand:- start:57 stop:1046 length:990 start_codon:yes stop_codon:yes gene_type:complete